MDEIAGKGGQNLDDQVKRGKDGIESLLGHGVVSIKGALEVGVGALSNVGSGAGG